MQPDLTIHQAVLQGAKLLEESKYSLCVRVAEMLLCPMRLGCVTGLSLRAS